MYCNMDFFTLNMEYLPPRPLQEPNIEQHLCGYSISNTLPFISVEILISSLQASTSPRPPTHRTTLAGASNCLSHPSHPFRAAEGHGHRREALGGAEPEARQRHAEDQQVRLRPHRFGPSRKNGLGPGLAPGARSAGTGGQDGRDNGHD